MIKIYKISKYQNIKISKLSKLKYKKITLVRCLSLVLALVVDTLCTTTCALSLSSRVSTTTCVHHWPFFLCVLCVSLFTLFDIWYFIFFYISSPPSSPPRYLVTILALRGRTTFLPLFAFFGFPSRLLLIPINNPHYIWNKLER